MKTLLTNALIIPMTEDGLSFYGDIGIDGKTISFVGVRPDSFVADTVIDCTDMLAMPALVNAHTHLAMQFMRNYKDNAPNLQAWLSEIFPIEDKLTRNDVLISSRLGVIELIQSGITLFNDMYPFYDATAQAASEGGIRANLGITLFGDLSSTRERLSKAEQLMTKITGQGNANVTFSVAPHAVYTCTKDTYQYGHEWAKQHGQRLHTHLSETLDEVEQCQKEHGMTPLHYLEHIGVLQDISTLLAHCVHLTASEIAVLQDMPQASVIHNPSSNCKLACGIAPVGLFREHGINVALGCDGSSSNNNQNLFEEMHVSSLLSTVSTRNPQALPPYEILKMATINGAHALGLADVLGTLQTGKEADILLLDLKKAHLTPLNDPFSALVFAAQASDVDTLFCQGKMVMHKRAVLGFEQEIVMRETNATWKDLRTR